MHQLFELPSHVGRMLDRRVSPTTAAPFHYIASAPVFLLLPPIAAVTRFFTSTLISHLFIWASARASELTALTACQSYLLLILRTNHQILESFDFCFLFLHFFFMFCNLLHSMKTAVLHTQGHGSLDS